MRRILALGLCLLADPGARQIKLVSRAQAYVLAKKALPRRIAKLLKNGDVPALYLVGLVDRGAATAFAARYAGLPGVSEAQPCRGDCTVDSLRAAGILH